jgi:succinoglycan biosynthesis protein ExoM
MLVAVCIATFQRSEGLKRLLDALNLLTFSKCELPDLEVIVIDNDSSGSASAVCEQMTDFKWALKYHIEQQRGISYARNRAVASIDKKSRFLVFIDDDEVPESNWLDELLFVQQSYQADVVAGAVVPIFPEPGTPDWASEGKFFQYGRFPTGHFLNVAFTNNVLINTEIFEKFDTIFDKRFALSGGEDAHFFMRVYLQGYKMVWADEALVYEWIPKSRTNIPWVLRRGFRTWGSQSICERELQPSIQLLFIRALKGITLVLYGLVLLLPSLLRKRYRFIQALLNISRGFGTLFGLAGWSYQEYQKVHKV